MRLNLDKSAVLVLNASYEAIGVVSAKRAFKSILKGAATVEQPSGRVIRAGRSTFIVPAVIRFLKYRKIPHRNRVLSRKGILARDQHQCQYCFASPAKLTLDHIIPQSRGGHGTWENLVAACVPCNNRKADRTPEEAGMPLQRRPRPFTVHTPRQLLRESARMQDTWQPYLFYRNDTPQETVQ